MLEVQATVTEGKNAFSGPLGRLDRLKKESLSLRIRQYELQNKEGGKGLVNGNKISKSCRITTKDVTCV